MASKLYNLARMLSTTTGTGSTIALDGGAVSGYLTFALAGVQNGDVIDYAIKDGANSEVGTATYSTTGPQLTGRTVTKSTNSDAELSLSGAAEIAISPRAETLNDASSLSNGTLPAARLPNPSSSTLGGVQSDAGASNNFLTGISTSGVPQKAQPSFGNISGNITVSQMNSGSGASASSFWRGDGSWSTNVAPIASPTFTGVATAPSASAASIAASASSASAYQVIGPGGATATYMTFHRPGVYATHFGLDSDNQFKFGGWSAGAVSYKFWTEANLNDPSNASNLASGTVPTARLGSGTANSSTYLRGDNTWGSAGSSYSAGSGLTLASTTFSINTNNATGVGSYRYCYVTGGSVASGATIAGSSLNGVYFSDSGGMAAIAADSVTMSGTWRNMDQDTKATNRTGLFMRTA